MYEDVIGHGKPGQRAAAGMAVMKWIHYHEECATYAAVEAAEKILESEMSAPEEHAEAPEEQAPAEPASAPAEPAAKK